MLSAILHAKSGSSVSSAGATRYAPLWAARTGDLWNATENLRRQVISAGGTLKKMSVKVSAAPGAGKTFTFTLRLNGADTALTVTISDTDTTGHDFTNTVTVAAGDIVDWKLVGSASAASTVPMITVLFDSTTAKQSLMMFCNDPLNNLGAATRYWPICGYGTFSTVEAEVEQVCAVAGTLKRLYIQLDTAPGVGNSRIFTVFLNGVAQSLAVTISGTNTAGNDTSNTVTVAAGDRLSIRSTVTGSPVDSQFYTGVTMEATTDGEFPIPGGSAAAPSNSATNYGSLNFTESYTFTTTEADTYSIASPMTLKKLYIHANAAPGAGKSYAFTLRKNAADQALTATLADANTSANDASNSFTSVEYDNLSVKIVPSGTPGSPGQLRWGMVGVIITTTTVVATIQARARIKQAGVAPTVTAKARIKQLAVAPTIQARARVKQLGVAQTVTAKAKILTGSTQSIQAKAAVKQFGVAQTVTAKAAVKQSNVAQTIQARARIRQTVAPTITAMARIKPTVAITIQAKSRVAQMGVAKTVTAKGAIKQLGVAPTITARAKISVAGVSKSVQAKARISVRKGFVKMPSYDQQFPKTLSDSRIL